jgi:hypothetical protein
MTLRRSRNPQSARRHERRSGRAGRYTLAWGLAAERFGSALARNPMRPTEPGRRKASRYRWWNADSRIEGPRETGSSGKRTYPSRLDQCQAGNLRGSNARTCCKPRSRPLIVTSRSRGASTTPVGTPPSAANRLDFFSRPCHSIQARRINRIPSRADGERHRVCGRRKIQGGCGSSARLANSLYPIDQ